MYAVFTTIKNIFRTMEQIHLHQYFLFCTDQGNIFVGGVGPGGRGPSSLGEKSRRYTLSSINVGLGIKVLPPTPRGGAPICDVLFIKECVVIFPIPFPPMTTFDDRLIKRMTSSIPR